MKRKVYKANYIWKLLQVFKLGSSYCPFIIQEDEVSKWKKRKKMKEKSHVEMWNVI